MAKRPKLTKKMLSVLDKAEVRTIIMTGMGVKPETAYQADVKWCIDHIYTNQEEFSTVNLESIEMKRFRNPAVYMYVRRLQGFLQGENEAPSWPPTPDDMENATQSTIVEVVKPVVPKKVAKTSTEAKSVDVFENVAKEEDDGGVISQRGKAVQAPKNVGSPVKEQIAFTKVPGFGINQDEVDAEETPVGVSVEDLESVLKETVKISDHVSSLQNSYEKLSEDFKTLSQNTSERIYLLENALLFIINSALLPDGQEIDDLKQVPSPPYN